MNNLFLQYPPKKIGVDRTRMNEELGAQLHAQLARDPSKRTNIGLWTGNLLIRMGKKLTEREIDLKTNKEHA